MMKFIPVDPISAEHLGLLFVLLRARRPHENISHERMPSFSEHCAFVGAKPYLAWYLLEVDKVGRVGAIYLTHAREIGIHLLPAYQGEGYGKAAIELLMKCYPGDFYANIAPLNQISQAFFTRLGFKHIQQTYLLKGNDDAGQTEKTP